MAERLQAVDRATPADERAALEAFAADGARELAELAERPEYTAPDPPDVF